MAKDCCLLVTGMLGRTGQAKAAPRTRCKDCAALRYDLSGVNTIRRLSLKDDRR